MMSVILKMPDASAPSGEFFQVFNQDGVKIQGAHSVVVNHNCGARTATIEIDLSEESDTEFLTNSDFQRVTLS